MVLSCLEMVEKIVLFPIASVWIIFQFNVYRATILPKTFIFPLFEQKSMKKEFRNLIKMRYFEDMSFKEMETILNQSQNTIRVKLFRAKKMLANLLKGE